MLTDKLVHPLTGTEYESQDEYVEALIESYRSVAKELYNVQGDQAKLVAALDAVAGDDHVRRGSVRVSGVTQVAKVDRRQNVTYPKPRGQRSHPLRELMKLHPQLADMVNVDYKEKGSAISALIERYHDHALHEPDDQRLAEELLEVRSVKQGKPGITIEDRKDVG